MRDRGSMGLFDGYSRDKGSAAEIANLLNLPVVLVINAGQQLILLLRCYGDSSILHKKEDCWSYI